MNPVKRSHRRLRHRPALSGVRVVAAACVSVVCLLAVLSFSGGPARAHEGGDGYSWYDDPANTRVFADCSGVRTNFLPNYVSSQRLTPEVSASAVRLEVVSADAVVVDLVVAATNWSFHAEQPDSVAHAERTGEGFPPAGLLVRAGFERLDAQVGPPVSFQVRVFAASGGDPQVFEFAVPAYPRPEGRISQYLSNFVCREEASTTASTPVGTSTVARGGFVVVVGTVSVLVLAAVLLLRTRRR